jgi:hypothetical protein
VQKVRLAEACERAGLPMDGIAAAIRAGGCRWRSWRRPRALRGPVLASGADQLAASAGQVLVSQSVAEWASPPA